MKTLRHLAAVVFLIALCASFSLADEPGKHPHYLHALSDLRDARAHLERITPSERQNDEEMRAIDEIDKASAKSRRLPSTMEKIFTTTCRSTLISVTRGATIRRWN